MDLDSSVGGAWKVTDATPQPPAGIVDPMRYIIFFDQDWMQVGARFPHIEVLGVLFSSGVCIFLRLPARGEPQSSQLSTPHSSFHSHLAPAHMDPRDRFCHEFEAAVEVETSSEITLLRGSLEMPRPVFHMQR